MALRLPAKNAMNPWRVRARDPRKGKEGDPWNGYVAPHELALLERPDTADGSASRSGLVNRDDTADVSAREP